MNLGTFRVAGKNPAKGELEKGNRGFRRESKILFFFWNLADLRTVTVFGDLT